MPGQLDPLDRADPPAPDLDQIALDDLAGVLELRLDYILLVTPVSRMIATTATASTTEPAAATRPMTLDLPFASPPLLTRLPIPGGERPAWPPCPRL